MENIAPQARQMEIPARLDRLAAVRAFIEEWCAEAGVPVQICWALVLATDELCSNIIRHGYRHDVNGKISVQIERRGTDVVVMLRDTAPPFDPVRAPLRPADRLQRSGHGLMIANQLARIGYTPKSEHIPVNTTSIIVPMEVG
jgi:anti-sigma regulatory factor (Ser/Thr protein kinase)